MTPNTFFPIHNSPFSWMICLKPHEGLDCAQVPPGMHLKNRQVPAFVSRISLQNLVKQWFKHSFYQGTAVRFSWMRWFFQSHVEFYRMSKIAGLELPTRNALKTDQTSIFSDPFASDFFPKCFFHLTWDLNIYNCHLECIKKSSNLVFVSIVGLQI